MRIPRYPVAWSVLWRLCRTDFRAGPSLWDLAGCEIAARSMARKVAAAVRFASDDDGRTPIGSLSDIAEIVAGEGGTSWTSRSARAVWDKP